jgi:hypothetical protein
MQLKYLYIIVSGVCLEKNIYCEGTIHIFNRLVIGHFCTLRGLETDKLERVALLTVETEMKGDLKSSIEWDLSLVGSLGLSCRYKRFLFCLGCFTA